jgi:hypothetical protein
MHPQAVHPWSTERREQRGVNVDDAIAKGCDDSRRHQFQVPGENDQVHVVLMERFQPLGAIGGIPEHHCRDPESLGVPQSTDARPVAQYQHYLGASEVPKALEQREEVTASARDAHGDLQRHGARN